MWEFLVWQVGGAVSPLEVHCCFTRWRNPSIHWLYHCICPGFQGLGDSPSWFRGKGVVHQSEKMNDLTHTHIHIDLHLPANPLCMCLGCGKKAGEKAGQSPCRHRKNMETPPWSRTQATTAPPCHPNNTSTTRGSGVMHLHLPTTDVRSSPSWCHLSKASWLRDWTVLDCVVCCTTKPLYRTKPNFKSKTNELATKLFALYTYIFAGYSEKKN